MNLNRTLKNIILISGVFEFKNSSYEVKEGRGFVELTIDRKNGKSGNISIGWETISNTAIIGRDFSGVGGNIQFDSEQESKMLQNQ